MINIYTSAITTEKELITPPLDGLILPGVTRLSILELAREWNEFHVIERTITMPEVVRAREEGRVVFLSTSYLC